jgi:predicted permease
MRLFARLRSWFKWIVKPQRLENEMETEVRFHMESYAADLVRSGVPQQEALRRAHIEFGGIESHKDAVRASLGLRLWGELCADLRYGAHMLLRNPVFTAVIVLTLALGIGANTAIFSLIDAVMLKMLPVQQPEQLILLKWASQSQPGMMPRFVRSLSGDAYQDEKGRFTSTSFSYPIFEDIQRGTANLYSGVLAFSDADKLNVGANGEAGLAVGEYVSGDYFSTLGVRSALGRTISPADDAVGANPAMVISYDYWTRRFGRDPSLVGKTITVNGIPFTLAGVTASEFYGVQPGSSIEVWIPLRTQPMVVPARTDARNGEVSKFADQGDWWVQIMARLKAGTSEQQATAALDVILQQNVSRIPSRPGANGKIPVIPHAQSASASRGLDSLRDEFSRPLSVLMTVVGLVLLIACANVASLLLSRAATRQREIATRLALGAGQQRLIRQLLTESVLLATTGGVLGVALAYWASDLLLAFMSGGRNPVILHVSPNLHVLGFTVGISVLTGILFGLAPALRSIRLDLAPALKEGGAKIVGQSGQSRGMRLGLGKTLVVAQVALSLLLLIAAGLFVRTLSNLQNENFGFSHRNLLLFGIDPTQAGYKGERLQSFYEELRWRIEAIPGVQSASISSHSLIDDGMGIDGISIQGYAPKAGDRCESCDVGTVGVHINSVGPRFFETFGIPLMLGRTIDETDREAAPKVGVINSVLARRYFGSENPIGRRFGLGDSTKSGEIAIVGVVGDTRYDEIRKEPPPTVYIPYMQHPDALLSTLNFEVRTAGDPKGWIEPIRRTAQGLDRTLPLFNLKTQTEQIEQATFQERLFARLSSFFGLLALGLACVGLYGLMSSAVARRTNEIGIRMALGAPARRVLLMVLRETSWLAVIGIGTGIGAALMLTQFLRTMLFGLKPTDPFTLTGAALLLFAIAMVAGWIPARRASLIQPMQALRHE